MEDFVLFHSAPPLLLRMEISTSVRLAAKRFRLRPAQPNKNFFLKSLGPLNGPRMTKEKTDE
jgi:hypothetical protein